MKNHSKKNKEKYEKIVEEAKRPQDGKKNLSVERLKDLMNHFAKKAGIQLSSMKINILQPYSQYQERKKREEEERKLEEQINRKQKEQRIEEECQICQSRFSETNFPLKLSCKHTFCIQCLQRIISAKVDIPKQRFILECPYRDSEPQEIKITTNVISDLLFRALGYPPEQAYQSPKMRDLVKKLKVQRKSPPKKFAPGITLTYECVDCNPAPVKQIYCGLKSYSLVNMDEQECSKCYSLMPITEIFFQDCAFKINGDGEEKVNIVHNCLGKQFRYKLPQVGWDYLDFSASKPNT